MQARKPKEGDDQHIRGFILNKLYLGGYFGKKHTDVDNMPKGYPPEYRGKFPKIIKELKRDGYVTVFPHGSEKHIFAISSSEKIDSGILICNTYRESVGLPPLNKKFREIIK